MLSGVFFNSRNVSFERIVEHFVWKLCEEKDLCGSGSGRLLEIFHSTLFWPFVLKHGTPFFSVRVQAVEEVDEEGGHKLLKCMRYDKLKLKVINSYCKRQGGRGDLKIKSWSQFFGKNPTCPIRGTDFWHLKLKMIKWQSSWPKESRMLFAATTLVFENGALIYFSVGSATQSVPSTNEELRLA